MLIAPSCVHSALRVSVREYRFFIIIDYSDAFGKNGLAFVDHTVHLNEMLAGLCVVCVKCRQEETWSGYMRPNMEGERGGVESTAVSFTLCVKKIHFHQSRLGRPYVCGGDVGCANTSRRRRRRRRCAHASSVLASEMDDEEDEREIGVPSFLHLAPEV